MLPEMARSASAMEEKRDRSMMRTILRSGSGKNLGPSDLSYFLVFGS
jgi:hypothetical protein